MSILGVEITDPDQVLRVLDATSVACEPSTVIPTGFASFATRDEDIYSVDRTQGKWILQRRVGKIQPKAEGVVSGLHVGSSKDGAFVAEITLYADNLPAPETVELRFTVETGTETVPLDEILKRI